MGVLGGRDTLDSVDDGGLVYPTASVEEVHGAGSGFATELIESS